MIGSDKFLSGCYALIYVCPTIFPLPRFYLSSRSVLCLLWPSLEILDLISFFMLFVSSSGITGFKGFHRLFLLAEIIQAYPAALRELGSLYCKKEAFLLQWKSSLTFSGKSCWLFPFRFSRLLLLSYLDNKIPALDSVLFTVLYSLPCFYFWYIRYVCFLLYTFTKIRIKSS